VPLHAPPSSILPREFAEQLHGTTRGGDEGKTPDGDTHRPRVLVRASSGAASQTDWGSLLGNLARKTRPPQQLEVDWRVHDKTHLEFAIDYPFAHERARYVWEAYFFVPESFRLAQTTYDKAQIYDDLLSYVRLAVPEVPLEQLAAEASSNREDSLFSGLEETLRAASRAADGSDASRTAVRRLRVFACIVRSAGLDAQRAMLDDLASAVDADDAMGSVRGFVATTGRILSGYREKLAFGATVEVPEEVGVALRWVDEDLSLYLEQLLATASASLAKRARDGGDFGEASAQLAAAAVAESRYRKERGYPSVGTSGATRRELEHFEFRRHVLKRFTSSVLWLRHEIRDGQFWAVQTLYAFAAALAMAFALFATLRAMEYQEYLALYAVVLIVSYAVKDRMKAILQTKLSHWANKRFADHTWTIRDEERGETVGVVKERAGFRAFVRLPAPVLAARRATREHALEEFARPETVLWHEKAVEVQPRRQGKLPSPMMTEIFRLNIESWLANTDDPNRTVTFADPDENVVCSVRARRVYNLNVVYRLRGEEGGDTGWRRIRVVVTRKGIERIDPIG